MSLINDALKRASQAQQVQAQAQPQSQQGPAKTTSPVAPSAPPPPASPRNSPRTPSLALWLILAVGALLLAGGFLVAWALKPKTTTAERTPKPVPQPSAAIRVPPPVTANVRPERVTTPELPRAAQAPPESAPSSASTTESSTPVPVPAEAPPPVSAPAPQTDFPMVKLQGIFFSRSNPTAILNGKVCAVGATVGGARVTRIEAQSVTVEFQGQARVLELAQ